MQPDGSDRSAIWKQSDVSLPTFASGLFLQQEAYRRADYPMALKFVLPLAEQGNPQSQMWLGVLHRFGKGVPRDAQIARDP